MWNTNLKKKVLLINKEKLSFWLFGGGLGLIGALTNNLEMLLFAGLAIIVFYPYKEKEGVSK